MRPAAVRTQPSATSQLSTAFTSGGILQPGTAILINGVVTGQDPYGTGNNRWLISTHGNYIWSGNTSYGAPSTTSAPATLASTGGSGGSGVERWRSLTAQYFGGETDYALKIMACESGGNPNAVGGAGEGGLMQVHPVHANKVGGNLNALFDPATNLSVAKQIRDGSGWGAWTCSRK